MFSCKKNKDTCPQTVRKPENLLDSPCPLFPVSPPQSFASKRQHHCKPARPDPEAVYTQQQCTPSNRLVNCQGFRTQLVAASTTSHCPQLLFSTTVVHSKAHRMQCLVSDSKSGQRLYRSVALVKETQQSTFWYKHSSATL